MFCFILLSCICVYLHMYMCVCVCVCVFLFTTKAPDVNVQILGLRARQAGRQGTGSYRNGSLVLGACWEGRSQLVLFTNFQQKLLSGKIIFLKMCVCARVCACACECVAQCLCGSQKTACHFSPYVRFGDESQVVRLDSKPHYSLRHLGGPKIDF